MTDKYTLITNLRYVTIGEVRTYTNALLLSDARGQCGLRGFGVDPTWGTFDVTVPSLDYTVTDTQGRPLDQPRGGGFGNVFDCGNMQFAGGPHVHLWISDSKYPIQISPVYDNILDVWAVLPGLVRRYWKNSGMPSISWGPR